MTGRRRSPKPAQAATAQAATALTDPQPAAPLELLPPPTDHGRAVEQLLRWIAKGASTIEQAEALAKHFPTVDGQAVYADALAQIRSLANPDPVITRGFIFLAAQELYRRAVESGDISAGLRALRTLAQLAATADPPANEAPDNGQQP